MPSLALIGDSILDNASYAHPAPDTATHLAGLLGPAWRVRLPARDGARIADVADQLDRLDGRPDVAVLSVGGNDVTAHMDLLARRETSAAALLGELLEIADAFDARYERVAASVAARAGRTVLCTIYEPPLEPPVFARLARVPLAVLNDRIVRRARALGATALELRDVCREPADFTLQIEPSAAGAARIAQAIAAVVEDRGGR